MNIRLLTLLFAALFLIGIFPVLFVQSFSSASGGITSGFLLCSQDVDFLMAMSAIGLFSGWLDNEATLLMPLSVLIMLVMGSLIEINEHLQHGLHNFILGTIILFSMNIYLLRSKALFLYIIPISIWAYISGSLFLHGVPASTSPLFFMIGITVCSALYLAMGVALGIAISDKIKTTFGKFKNSPVYASFLSLF